MKMLSPIRLAKFKKYLAVSSYENYLDFQKFDTHATKRFKQIKFASFKSFWSHLETLEYMNKYIQNFLTMTGDTDNAEIPSLPEKFLSLDPTYLLPSPLSLGAP